MIIRESQLKAFQPWVDEHFLARALAHIRGRHPEVMADEIAEEDAAPMARAALRKARSHGLEREDCLVDFIELCFTVSPHFDRQPRIGALLRDANRYPDPHLRFLMLREHTLDADWAEAALYRGDDAL